MIYLFTPSYQSVLFILHQFPLDEITFVTYNPSIKEFAEKVGISIIYREEQFDLSTKGYKDYRKLCLDMIKGWEGRKIISGFYTFDIWTLYQLTRLKEKNKVFFYNTDYLTAPGFDESTSATYPTVNNSPVRFFNEKYRRILIKQKIFYFLTGLHLDLIMFGKDNFALGLALKRCRKLFLPYTKRNEPAIFKQNKENILKKFELSKIDILFIDGGEPNIEIPPEVLNIINSVIKSHNLKMMIKAHPTISLREELIPYSQIDKSLPVELLQAIPRLVIGIYSLGLRGFSTNSPTISLINLVTFHSDINKDRGKQTVEGAGGIIIPYKIEELNNLLLKLLD